MLAVIFRSEDDRVDIFGLERDHHDLRPIRILVADVAFTYALHEPVAEEPGDIRTVGSRDNGHRGLHVLMS